MSLPYKFFLQGRSPAARVRDTRARASAPPRVGNVPGQFYVDDTCIDCDVCRWMAPSTFSRVESASSVVQQPQDRESRISAMRAVLSCPTQSIHMRERRGDEFREAQGGFPLPVEGCPGVYHCGFHSADSFSATSYLIVREEGNIMMDCPRFNPVLARQIEQLGGVQHIVLSHIDDIADHDKWARHFNCKRIMHRTEIRRSISDIEIQLEGSGPWNLRGETIPETATDSGVLLIHTPGHTSGSICLWHEASKTMFTGDSLGYSNSMGRVSIFPRYNRAGISKQLGSIQHLLQWDWLHVLPGHGRRVHLRDATERLQLYHELVQAETATAGRY